MSKYCQTCDRMMDPVPDPENAERELCPACGAELAVSGLPQGFVLNGFRIEHEIGRGGMGIVYLATQINLQRQVAFKVLNDKLAHDTVFVEKFFREARAAGSLSHPNIVQAFDAGASADGIYYFVMELIEGQNLDAYVAENGALDIDLALNVSEKISSALAYAWDRQNLCHGDIKPENIILKTNGDIKLADLGLAKNYKDNSSGQEAEIMATPLYAAPELIRYERDKIGFRTDMYSFGATMYHLFAGEPPFPGTDPQLVCDMQLNAQSKPLIAVNPAIPGNISILVDKLMEKDCAKRPANWHEVHDAIQKVIDDKEEKAILSAAQKREADAARGQLVRRLARPVVYIPAAILLLAAAAGVYFLAVPSDVASVNPPSEQVTAPPRSPESGDPEWSALYDRLGALPPDEAVKLLESYISEKGTSAPVAARDALQFLRTRIANEEELQKFKLDMTSFQDDFARLDLVQTQSMHRLEVENNRVSSLLSRSRRSKYLRSAVSEENRKQLTVARDALRARIAALKEIARAEEQAKLAAALEEHRQQKEAESRAKREAELAAARRAAMRIAAYDDLARICSPLLVTVQPESAESILQMFEKWKKFYPEKDSAAVKIANQLESICRYSADPVQNVIVRNQERFKKMVLFNSGEYEGFVFESADDKCIRFSKVEGKVTFGKKLYWKNFNRKMLEMFLRSIFRQTGCMTDMDRKDIQILAAHFVHPLQQPSGMRWALQQAAMDDSGYAAALDYLGHLDLEWGAYRKLSEIREKLAAGQRVSAYSSAREMKQVWSDTDVYRRNSKEIESLAGR